MSALAVVLAAVAARGAMRAGYDLRVFYRARARFAAAPTCTPSWPASGRTATRAGGAAALFAPLAAFTFPVAKALWAGISAAAALGAAALLDRSLERRRPWAVPLAFILFLQPVAQLFALGQVDLVVLFLAVASFAAEDRGRDASAGALVAVAAALNALPAALALGRAVRRRWRAFAGAAGAALAFGLVLVPRYGPEGALAQHARWAASQSAEAVGMIDGRRALLEPLRRAEVDGSLDGAGASTRVAIAGVGERQAARRVDVGYVRLTAAVGEVDCPPLAPSVLEGVRVRDRAGGMHSPQPTQSARSTYRGPPPHGGREAGEGAIELDDLGQQHELDPLRVRPEEGVLDRRPGLPGV